MEYQVKAKVPSGLLQIINGYLEAKTESEFQSEDHTVSITVRFPDGYEMDVKCCGAKCAPSWTEAVLFMPSGEQTEEVSYSDPDDRFLKEWELSDEDEGNTYTVIVEDGGDIESAYLEPVQPGTPLSDGWSIDA